MKIFKEESGQVLVLTALSMVLLLGFVGMAADLGQLFHVKRNIQIAVDAAATAGALYQSYGESANDAGISAATNNGYTTGVNGASVTINTPPVYGPAAGETGFVEAIISTPNPMVFMSLFGFTSVTVSARAVAGPVPAQSCNFLENTTGTDLYSQGSATIEAPGGGKTCGFYSYSTSNNSIDVKGGSASYVNTNLIGTAGGLSGSGNAGNTQPTPVTTKVPIQYPPLVLSSIVAPVPGSQCIVPSGVAGTANVTGTKYTIVTQADIDAAVKAAGTLSPCFKGNVMLEGTSYDPSGTLTIPAGMWIFGPSGGPGTGEVAIGNNVTATGVTLDIYGDGGPSTENILTVTSTAQVSLDAPSSAPLTTKPTTTTECTATGGACYDVVLLAPASNTETFNVQWGSAGNATTCMTVSGTEAATLGFQGAIVAPGVNISLQDSGGYAMVTGMIVGSLDLKNGLLCEDNIANGNPNSPFSSLTLVE